ncbi:MAG TPA: hypothetical protein VE871_05790 [Longimicrobium sp.]|nr:hypothetical protein [Longimicrobium sp.]
MRSQKLSPETLTVESFATGTGTEGLPARDAAPTNNCNTRLTACTIGP